MIFTVGEYGEAYKANQFVAQNLLDVQEVAVHMKLDPLYPVLVTSWTKCISRKVREYFFLFSSSLAHLYYIILRSSQKLWWRRSEATWTNYIWVAGSCQLPIRWILSEATDLRHNFFKNGQWFVYWVSQN